MYLEAYAREGWAIERGVGGESRRRLCRPRTATRVRQDRKQPFKATRRVASLCPGIVFAPPGIRVDARPRWHVERYGFPVPRRAHDRLRARRLSRRGRIRSAPDGRRAF